MDRTLNKSPDLPRVFGRSARRTLCLIGFALAGAFLAAAARIPFEYPSPSILYKFGPERALLRAGQVCGALAGAMILLQGILAARLRFLDRMAGLPRLVGLHRWIGIVTAGFAVAHPLLILAGGDLANASFSATYWPEGVGLLLLLLVAGTVILAALRDRVGLPFHLWRIGHRLGTTFLVVLFALHVLAVGGSFSSGVPRLALLSALVGCGLLWGWVRLRPLRMRRFPFRVTGLEKATRDTWTVTLERVKGRMPAFHPGQFAFFRFRSAFLSPEEHPFTIASSPHESRVLQLTIRESGDWTRHVGGIHIGDQALMDGPYGLFGPWAYGDVKKRVFIAGGVGITPFLSLLRTEVREGEGGKTLLIWSNRSREDAPCLDEVTRLARELIGFDFVPVFTREASASERSGRVDLDFLKRRISDLDAGVVVFLCGPPGMMRSVREALKVLGFSGRVVTEAFHL